LLGSVFHFSPAAGNTRPPGSSISITFHFYDKNAL